MTPAASITTRLRVKGMDCAYCATKLQNALQRMPGISEVNVSVTGGTMTVRHDPNGADDDTIRDQLSNLARSETYRNDGQGKGEESSPAQHDAHSHLEEASGQRWWQTRKGQLTIASGGALAIAFAAGKAVPATEQWAFLLAMMVGLIPIAKRAISAAMAGTPFPIEMLMMFAAVDAVFIRAEGRLSDKRIAFTPPTCDRVIQVLRKSKIKYVPAYLEQRKGHPCAFR